MNTARIFPILLLLAAANGCGHAVDRGETAMPDGAVAVRTDTAQTRTIRESATGLGRCEALPQHLALLTAAVEGRVVRLLAQPGETVRAGEEIVRLDPTLAKANLAEREAARDAQAASLRLLESLPRTEEQTSARLAIEQAKLAVEKAQSAVDHLRPLRQRGEVSEVTMHEAEVGLGQARLQAKTAEAQYQVLMLKPRPQAIDEGRWRVRVAEAAVATARTQLDLLSIRAPIDGALDALTCHLGQMLSAGATVGQVVDRRQLHVVLWLAVPDAQRVHSGQTARIAADHVQHEAAGTAQPAIPGRVLSVGLVADPQTGNLPVRILVDNASGALTIGQAVSATIALGQERVLAVPAAAVYDLGEGPLLAAVREGKTLLLHPVLGPVDEGWVAVSGMELKPGDAVIVEGGYALPEGTRVAVEHGTAKTAGSEKSP
jgi:multidrug efflux pump subunit AcrA (membrane-fusion protein)